MYLDALIFCFFFKQKTAYEMRIIDWSSDVCSSDLVAIRPETDIAQAWREMGSDRGILEGWVDFAMEISVIVAHGLHGDTAAYVTVENRHVDHIIDTTIAPATIAPGVAAREIGRAPCGERGCQKGVTPVVAV